MKINRCNKSRVNQVDFSSIPFGQVFSDHMLMCTYKDGAWGDPIIVPYGPLQLSPATQGLHYGQSVFEGMKAFKDKNNNILLFREKENLLRLNQSAVRLDIPPITEEIFLSGLKTLVSLDHNWCKFGDSFSLYIRPFIFASSNCIKASSAKEYMFIIITSPTMSYYTKPIDLLFEENFSRAVKGGVGFAKAAGNYGASFYPTKLAQDKGYTQVIWTDAKEHKYIEESGTMNIWFRVEDKLITPKISDSILGGITRDSILHLAKKEGIKVEERLISVSEILDFAKNDKLIEVFGTGTAVSVISVRSITFRDFKISLESKNDSYAMMLKKKLQDIQYGRKKDLFNWTTLLSSFD